MAYQIRNNLIVSDPRLNRIEEFDHRSRQYPISSVLPSKKLRSYTWRCTEWFDQGAEGSCVAFALGHELVARPAEVRGLTPGFLVRYVYWQAQKIDPWDGGAYPGAMPQYEGTSVLAGVKVLHRMGGFKEYRWAFSTQDVLLGVGYNGPAVIGVPWYLGMLEPDENGFIHPTGALAGGHAVLVRAVNVKKEFVTIRNSWGRGWGRDGDCYMTFDDLNTVLGRGGEAVFMKKRKTSFISV